MPSLFRKSTSETITLSETNRKVLHKCRMLLIKDLEVTEILEYMSHDDCFRSDARDAILALPSREQRVGMLLDRLEVKGDRAFSLFMEALREHSKQLHYALDEALRTVDERKDSVKDYRLSVSGDTLRRHLRNNLRRRMEAQCNNDSLEEIEAFIDENRNDTYIDCYAIPMRGLRNRDRWIKNMPLPLIEAGDTNEEDADGETYMGTILRELLFKKIELSDIPEGVRTPAKYSNVYVLDKDNKYGLIRKQPKERYNLDMAPPPGVRGLMGDSLDMDVGLDNDWGNEQLPDYTAPPPPTLIPAGLPGKAERHRNDSGDSCPPPPLPPKPGNLPPLNIPPAAKPRPPEPPAPAVPPPNPVSPGPAVPPPNLVSPAVPPPNPVPQQQNPVSSPNEVMDNGEIVKPPPRSTSLSQQPFEDKPLPLPTRKSSKGKLAKFKERTPSGSSFNDKSLDKSFDKSLDKSFDKSHDKSFDKSFDNSGDKSASSTPTASPPIPPRKYFGFAKTNEEMTGSGALGVIAAPHAPPPLPRQPPPDLELVNNPSATTNSNTDISNTLPQATIDLEGHNLDPSHVTSSSENHVRGDPVDFDPYSLHADNAFQVRDGNKDSGDVTSEGDNATGSSNATLTFDNPDHALTSQDTTEEDYETVATRPVIHSDDAVMGGANGSVTSDVIDSDVTPASDVTPVDSTSRDSTPFDSDDTHLDTSRELSNPEDSLKASADSLDSEITPGGSQEPRSDVTTDSGIGGAASGASAHVPTLPHPPMLKQRNSMSRGSSGHGGGGKHTGSGQKDSAQTPELSEVQVLADGDSSDANSYYESIDTFEDKSNPFIPLLEPSERTSVSYLDPKTYFKAIEKMAQQGLCQEGTLKRIALVEEWEASGRALLCREDLVVAEVKEACSIPKTVTMATAAASMDTVAAGSSSAAAAAKEEDASRPHSSTSESEFESPPPPTVPQKDPYEPFRNTVLVFDKLGRALYVPSKYVRRHGDPDGEPWYYPIELTSHQATLFLGAEKQEGCFLVYKPKSKRSPNALYNLSICRDSGDVVHYHIIEIHNRGVMIEGHDHTFLNVVDLVRYFQRNKSQLATKLRRPLKEATLPITPGYHYDLQWEVSRSHLRLTGRILGQGNYGVVCAGMYHKHIPVAVKVLQYPGACSTKEEDDFIEEARCLMGLNHEHVVRFVGLSCTAKPFYLVSEYLSKGNLQNCLRNNIVPSDNIEQLFDICIQVTSAMEYLESRHFVLHRDLATRNFLVSDDLCVKLADFGRAVHVIDDNYQASRNEKIPIKWASPEVLVDWHYSTKSDVWALGVVFWEILSGGERPYEHFSPEQTAVYVTEGGRLEKPVGCPMDLYHTMKRCWCENPDDRPSFASLLEKLKSKSSIYYYSSSPVNNQNSSNNGANGGKSANRSSSSSNATSSSKSMNGSSFRVSSRQPKSPTVRRKNHAFMIDTRTDRRDSERRINAPFNELQRTPQRSHLGGADRFGTSGSETSLTSALERDEMSRGGKIRKSIRKMISIRSKKKPPGLEGLREDSRGKAQSNNYGSQYM